MAGQKKVIDESVIIKWFLDESHSDAARLLLEEHCKGELLLIVPQFAFLEVLNALRYKCEIKEMPPDILDALYTLQLRIVQSDQFLIKKTIEIAIEYDLSIYDAVYAALASVYGISLVTENRKLLNVPNVVRLG